MCFWHVLYSCSSSWVLYSIFLRAAETVNLLPFVPTLATAHAASAAAAAATVATRIRPAMTALISSSPLHLTPSSHMSASWSEKDGRLFYEGFLFAGAGRLEATDGAAAAEVATAKAVAATAAAEGAGARTRATPTPRHGGRRRSACVGLSAPESIDRSSQLCDSLTLSLGVN